MYLNNYEINIDEETNSSLTLTIVVFKYVDTNKVEKRGDSLTLTIVVFKF